MMRKIDIDTQSVTTPTEALDLFGEDVTPEALEAYMHANYQTGAQKSLMTAILLATL